MVYDTARGSGGNEELREEFMDAIHEDEQHEEIL